MRSLRARLLAAVLGLSAAGLLLVGAVTYAEQRSFQLERVDRQVHAARGGVLGALEGRGPARPFEHGRPPGPGRGPDVGLPPGTYGQRRDANGQVLDEVVLSYDQRVAGKPDLPADIPLERTVTVDGADGSGTRYRALASPSPDGSGTLVVAVPLTEVDRTLHRLLLVEGLVIAAVLLLLGAAAWVVVRIGLLPLDRVGDTAGAIAGGDLSRRVATTDPRTEVGRLGIALNAMLDRLQAAFEERQASEDRLREFLADASHELRTPLSSIRGYAELFRMGAARDPAELAKAMRRIEEEAERMGVLVEDLLTLARLDEVRDAPHGAVDLGRLARDAVDDARVTAPDRTIDITVEGPATVLGEPHQLRQVLANLLRNALVHTPAGTPVEVTVAPDGGDVRLAVRDHGPGLPADDPTAPFERFWRAEGGRERGAAGAGLGLAIVAGVVDAHGGRVHAANAADGGAAFVVHLPAAAASRR
jgi:two-component system OmpR family sensor kinase